MHFIPRPCVPLNSHLRRLRLILSLGHLNRPPSSMDRRSGHAHRTPKDLLEQISLSSLMGRCAVQQSVPCMRKNGALNALAPCACCMPRGSVIAARVSCAHSVKKKVQIPSNHDASVRCSGQSSDHLLNLLLPLRFLKQLSRSCGGIGSGASTGGGCV